MQCRRFFAILLFLLSLLHCYISGGNNEGPCVAEFLLGYLSRVSEADFLLYYVRYL